MLTSHLSEWPKYGTLKTANSGKVPELECKMVQPTWKTVWQFLTKLHILFLYDLVPVLLGIDPQKLTTYVHIRTCPWKLTAALVIITQTRKPPRSPRVGGWVSNPWNIQTGEYYSAPKRNEPRSHEKTQRDFKCERSLSENATHGLILTPWHSGKGKTMEMIKR